ncbi:MAG: Ldh family oxidoreductase [Candidatus Omnitrophica bacterium]|nr:Ldh family oxidoreductase [Candidatus Omnitrophota bacterium]
MTKIRIPVNKLKSFAKEVLLKAGTRKDVAEYVAEGLAQTSLRGVDSHGIRLFPHYLEGVKKGRINPKPKYKFKKTSATTGLFDADHTFGHAAGMEAAKKAVKLASEAGTGHIAIYNSSHFGAAAYYALEIAKHDMIGMSFTNTDALVKTYAGKRSFLGNNPICFAAPCKDEEPFCLDMATSIVTFNKIKQLCAEGKEAPPGVGTDKEGMETTKSFDISMLLPMGTYKGYGLSMVIEILCSLLTGAPYGPHIPKMFERPMNEKRYLGHFIIAINIGCFQKINVFKERLSCMMNELRSEPRLNAEIPIQIAGDPEKNAARKRTIEGIPVDQEEYERFKKIANEYKIVIDFDKKGDRH